MLRWGSEDHKHANGDDKNGAEGSRDNEEERFAIHTARQDRAGGELACVKEM